MDIRLNHLYHDAASNKRRGSVIIDNPRAFPLPDIWQFFANASPKARLFANMIHFRTEQEGPPTLSFTDIEYDLGEDDLDLHQVLEIFERPGSAGDVRSFTRIRLDLHRANL